MYAGGGPAAWVVFCQLLRLLTFMQIGAGQQHAADTRRLRARHHIITIFGKLGTGEIHTDIKHTALQPTTALTGG